MALITCPECSREISDTVTNCPHCGFAIENATITIGGESLGASFGTSPSTNTSNYKFIIGIVVGLIVIVAGIYFLTKKSPDTLASEKFNELVTAEMTDSLLSSTALNAFLATGESEKFGLQMISLGHYMFNGENDPKVVVDSSFATHVSITRNEANTLRQQALTDETLSLIDDFAGQDAAVAFIVFNTCNRMAVDKEDILEEFIGDELYGKISAEGRDALDLDPICDITDGSDHYVVDPNDDLESAISLNGKPMELSGFMVFIDLVLSEE